MATEVSSKIGSIFGDVIKDHRLKAGLSQERLALEAGVDRTFVSRLERGLRQPTISTVMALGEALGVSAADLVKETEKRFKAG
jgi:transcriptional regulator with XRE-family HTH domain